MQTDYPLISVLVCCYNNQKYLYDSLKSIFSQTYPNIEILISDDASDNFNGEQLVIWLNRNKTVNINKIAVYENQFPIGMVACIDNLKFKSRGEWLFNISANDVFFDKDTIMKMYSEVIMARENIEILIADNELWNEKLEKKEGTFFEDNTIREVMKWPSEKLFEEVCVNKILPSCYLYKRNLLKTIGTLSDKYKVIEDWPTQIRLLRNDIKPYFYDSHPSVKMRRNNITETKEFYQEWYNIYANEIEPYLDRLDIEKRNKVKRIALDGFREYYEAQTSCGDISCLKVPNKGYNEIKNNKILNRNILKNKISRFADIFFSNKVFLVSKRYINKFGLKKTVHNIASKKGVLLNGTITFILLLGCIISCSGDMNYVPYIFGVLFFIGCCLTLSGILLHYYLLNRV